ncbi:hypothetical protein [Salinisphaera sp. G21_0]|uniref:hypothetical protein n=1 Tax=Salinisphaera sp. G21_0 TaxID=2821094 RepID=UPI001ADC9918|nr:hypothetical protein [Salinisphaera sp. G21_0]MBO9482101.1 hypothetical protein [Salinisphaera sp. G21_0]
MKKYAFLLLLLIFSALINASSNKPTSTAIYSDKHGLKMIVTEESDSFARQMTANTPGKGRKQALQNYINSLLKAHAVYSQDESQEKPTLVYQIQANQEGTIVATRSEQSRYGVQIGNRSLPVYGIHYDLESDCSWQEQLCWVFYPSSHQQKERWLEIAYAPHVIGELTEGVSLLIRNLQK